MTSIKMPQLGETIIEGTILKWLKKEGETVAADEPLFEISTDKVDTEVPSPIAGVVTQILVPEGSTVAVGTELAVVESADESAASAAAPAAPAIPEAPPVAAVPTPVAAVAAPAAPATQSRRRARHQPPPLPYPPCPTVDRARRSSRRSCGGSPPSIRWIWRSSPAQGPGAGSPSTTS